MKKKIILFLTIWIIVISGIIIYFYLTKDKDNEIIVDNTLFTLVDDMTVEVYDDVLLSSKIKSIDGKIIEDKKIDTNSLGEKTIKFLYTNEKGKKRKGTFKVEVVDSEEPIILLNDSYSVTVGYNKLLTDVILSADNYDSNPKREIIGEYDMNKVGSYPLIYQVTDSNGNIAKVEFNLYVKERISSYTPTYKAYKDIVDNYKTEKTKIGIDVSKWQGSIDFEKIKASGVEFIIIRVGTGTGFGEESVVDKYFKQNIEGAIEVGIPVGIYYYSYATTKEEANEQAEWVMNQIKDYQIDLPVAFDWESWPYFNGLNLSINDINEIANTFKTTIEKGGYNYILYGSKNYLQNIWKPTEPVWLAHYTTNTNYDGKYKFWQLCDNGKIDGINGYVDINVMYE